MRARPGSSLPAIRLIDAWRADGATRTDEDADAQEAADPIPKRIVQYWDRPDLPASIAPVVASWAGAEGFDHRLYDRRAARDCLGDAFGADWVKAFGLGQNPAEEADLLRLCLLAHEGGVYADADDFLHGDLAALLGEARGLVFYRENLGGALGNNFIAAAPNHPVMVYAARAARDALNQRSVELAWTKTGPGLLTRAVGLYLAQADWAEARRQIRVLDWPEFAAQVSIHNPVYHKAQPAYWENAASRRRTAEGAWDQIREAWTGAL